KTPREVGAVHHGQPPAPPAAAWNDGNRQWRGNDRIRRCSLEMQGGIVDSVNTQRVPGPAGERLRAEERYDPALSDNSDRVKIDGPTASVGGINPQHRDVLNDALKCVRPTLAEYERLG